ncbi:MAG: hypothetical protein U1E31_00875 [Rickettsiales bacterium]
MHINQFYNEININCIKQKLSKFYLNLKQNYALEILIDLFNMQNIKIQIGFEVEFYIKTI